MKHSDILGVFKKTGALLEGHFLLSSGLHSERYLQCALLLQYGTIATQLCDDIARQFKDASPTVVVAPALGGVIVSHEVARALGARGIFTERVHGVIALRRGFFIDKNDRVLVVEDVITTGNSTKEVLEAVKRTGAAIIGVGCIADRSGGTADFGVPFKSLIGIDIPAYSPDACPLCQKNIPVVKPGSREGSRSMKSQ